MKPLKHYRRGFTIVELLVVIVVIGILASIVIVAYRDVQRSSLNAKAVSGIKEWQRLFQAYKSTYGQFPPLTDADYCLGSGFPNGYCRQINGPIYPASTSAAVNAEISKIATPPKNNAVVVGNYVGPWLRVYQGGQYYLIFYVFSDKQQIEDEKFCSDLGGYFAWKDSAQSLLQCNIYMGR